MKKKLGVQGIFMLLFCFICLFAADRKAEAAQTVTSGSYTYFAEQGTVYRMNSKTGAVRKVYKVKGSNTVNVVGVKDSWIYLVADDYYYTKGTDNSWEYVCRVKTSGKSFQRLDKGANAVVYGSYIYYERLKYDKKDGSYANYVGHYRMKLNGKSKRKLTVKARCSWMKIYKKRIYLCGYLNNQWGIYSMNLSGKGFRTEVATTYSIGDDVYFTGNRMYFSQNQGYDINYIYCYNLSRREYVYLKPGDLKAGYNGELYYTTGNYGNYTLYRYNIAKKRSGRVCKAKMFNKVIGGKKWVIINYYRGNVQKNIGVDRMRLNGRSRRGLMKYLHP